MIQKLLTALVLRIAHAANHVIANNSKLQFLVGTPRYARRFFCANIADGLRLALPFKLYGPVA